MNNLEIAKVAVIKAQEKIKQILQNKIVVESSVGKDIKLKADKESEQVIVNYLKEKSQYPIVSEEQYRNKKYDEFEKVWIVDPLDGSMNLLRGIPFYGISIGLWGNGRPLLGVVLNLVNNELAWTHESMKNAYINNAEINVSKIINKNESVICTGFPVYSDFNEDKLLAFVKKIQEYKKVRLLGSAALSILLVAKGASEVYAEDNIAIWDVAGALAVLKAAGGNYFLSKGKENNIVNVVATNGKINL